MQKSARHRNQQDVEISKMQKLMRCRNQQDVEIDKKARAQKTSNASFEKMSLFSMTKECKKQNTACLR